MVKRWGEKPGLQPEAFILAKIRESRLQDIHPMYGGTRGTFHEYADFPPLESGLFSMSEVAKVEAEDFSVQEDSIGNSANGEKASIKEPSTASKARRPETASAESPTQTVGLGSPEWRRETARAAANAKHDKPGGSREKKKRLREIWASGKYTSRDICAEEECAGLGMAYSTARRALFNTPEPRRSRTQASRC